MEGRLGQLLLRQFYKPFDDKVVEVLEELLAGWGRKMKPPMDVRSFSTLLNEVAEGLALRARVDRSAVSSILFEKPAPLFLAEFGFLVGGGGIGSVAAEM